MNPIEDLGSTQSFSSHGERISSPKEYDIVVLGSGEGGKYLA
ncbi:MAG: hypothetical protein WA869_04710 [Alloacidobacterium sp.]